MHAAPRRFVPYVLYPEEDERICQACLQADQLTWAACWQAGRICSHCGPGALADELHVVHECPLLQPLRQQYAALFTPETATMRSFFGQRDHVQVFCFILDCLDTLTHVIRLVGWLKRVISLSL